MASFQDALRRRLGSIDARGESQTTWERLQNERKRSEALAKQQLDWQNSITSRLKTAASSFQNMPGNFTWGSPEMIKGPFNPKDGSGWQTMPLNSMSAAAFINAIAKQESGNNYNAKNKQSGALGKYQIMPSNIPAWSKEALGYSVTAQQFAASPQIQDQVAQFKLNQYYAQYGAAGAAIAWYAGPAAANNYMNTGVISNKSQGGNPSVQQYVNSIVGRGGW